MGAINCGFRAGGKMNFIENYTKMIVRNDMLKEAIKVLVEGGKLPEGSSIHNITLPQLKAALNK